MLRFVLLLLVAAVVAPAGAAEFSMTDLEGRGRQWPTMLIEGAINPDDGDRFIEFVKSHRVTGIMLDSPGGHLNAALEIGDQVRKMLTIVTVPGGAQCSSACVFIFQAGSERVMNVDGRLGLHRPSFPAPGVVAAGPSASIAKYNKAISTIREWWYDMGGTDAAFALMLTVGSDEILWVRRERAKQLGLLGIDPALAEYERAKRAVAAENPFTKYIPKN